MLQESLRGGIPVVSRFVTNIFQLIALAALTSGKGFRLSEAGQVSAKNELVITEGLPQTTHELATENATQHVDGKKEAIARFYPALVIERQPAGRNHTMDMGVKAEPLAPCVQHAEETDLCTEVSRIASHFEECFCAGTEQQVVENLAVL